MSSLTLAEEMDQAPEDVRHVKGEDLLPGDLVLHPNGKMAFIVRRIENNGPEYFAYYTSTEGDFWIGRAATKLVYNRPYTNSP